MFRAGRSCTPSSWQHQENRRDLPTGSFSQSVALREAGEVSEDYDEYLFAEGEICWDGWMFPSAVMARQQAWNDVLATMINLLGAHGWRE